MSTIIRSQIALPTDELIRFNTSFATVSTLSISSGVCRDSTDIVNIKSTSSITVDITASGVNGLDTGSEAASTWYYVYVILKDSDQTVAGLLSVSSTDPTMPSGYTYFRRIGEWRNDGSSNLLNGFFYGDRIKEIYYKENSGTTLRVLTGGTATSYTNVDLSSFVPPTSRMAVMELINSATTGVCFITENGASIDSRTTNLGSTNECKIITDSSQIIDYKVLGSATCSLEVLGFLTHL